MEMTRYKGLFKNAAAALLAFMLFITAAPSAMAQQTGSVTLTLKNTNVTFYIYQVGLLFDENNTWQCTLTDDFSGSALALSDLDSASASLAKASWLKTYVDNHKLEPYQKGVSDSSGKMTFSDLPEGLYLFVKTNDTESRVHVAPFLLTMPLKNPGGEGWVYDYAAVPKSEETRPGIPDRPDHPNGGSSTPGNPGEPPGDETVLVEDPDIPLARVEVPDNDVPLVGLPKTGGDMTAIICACGGVLLIMGGIVTVVAGICQPVYVSKKKRKKR